MDDDFGVAGRLEDRPAAVERTAKSHRVRKIAVVRNGEAALRTDRILVRRVGGYGLPDALRITVGDEDGVTRVTDSLGRFMQGRRA